MAAREILHHNIWSLAEKNRAAEIAKSPLRQRETNDGASDPSLGAGKLDDLQTSLMLYSYGLPIEAAVGSACTVPGRPALNCKTKSISSESVDFAYHSPTNARYTKTDVGAPVQFDLDKVGAFKGTIASQNTDGFQVAVDSSSKGALSAKLAEFASSRGVKHDVSIAAGSQITRLEPKNTNCCFTDHNGVLRDGFVVNLSRVDALIRTRFIPPIPSIIVFQGPRRYAAEITSTFVIGCMAKFCTPIAEKDFSPLIRFTD